MSVWLRVRTTSDKELKPNRLFWEVILCAVVMQRPQIRMVDSDHRDKIRECVGEDNAVCRGRRGGSRLLIIVQSGEGGAKPQPNPKRLRTATKITKKFVFQHVPDIEFSRFT